MTKNITMEFDEFLIMEVEQHPHLFDKNLTDFKNTTMIENTWAAIASKLNTDGKLL